MATAPLLKQRIPSIDILRGLIMLIMALDHTRDFFYYAGQNPTNLATTTPLLFFTRWITHYCAPTFLFLSGISAYLSGTKKTKKELSAYLIKRGLWLVLVEVVVMTFILTLNLAYNAIVLDILWAIGCSMILLGLLVRLPIKVIAIIGCVIFFGHDILDLIPLPAMGVNGLLIKIFFTAFGTVIPINSNYFIFYLYAIIPWTGVMLLGYCFGSLYKREINADLRKSQLLITGVCITILFIGLRILNFYGDPAPWAAQRNWVYSLLSVLNTSKYPPSLLFLCMTLGPVLIILALVEKARSSFSHLLIVYGNVPFFYYVLHFLILRVVNVIFFFGAGYTTSQIKAPGSPFLFSPATFGYPLWVVYLLWLCLIVAMYWPCKWYGNYKRTHTNWWLSYL
jgi:uncharacterized membrane protein